MNTTHPTRASIIGCGLGLALVLLAGCATASRPISVITPPPPIIGSAPIAAYDEYALAIKPRVGTPRAEHVILISAR